VNLNQRIAITLIFLLFFVVGRAQADRPACYKLLPAKTLAYVRIANLKELGEAANDTSFGRMMQEDSFQSLTQHLFSEAETAFEPVAEQIGLSLSEILEIPRGEIAIAVTAPPNGLPAPVLMIDIEGHEANVLKLTDALERRIELDGNLQKSTEVERGTKLTVFAQEADTRFTGLIHFQREEMLVMTSNLDVAKQILAAWDGDDEQAVLEQNDDFADVMRHSKGPREAVPQIRWFVDPISFAKVAMRGNFGAQAGLAMLPVVGADGLLALGGSITLATEEYDSFVQTHVITAEPRTGVLAALAMKSGDPTPEKWVPHDAASYTTLYWDFERTETEVSLLFDSFRGEDAFQREVISQINKTLDVDFEEDLLGVLSGRASLATWYTKPTRINGTAFLGGIQLVEDHDFEQTLKHIIEYTDNNLEERSWAGFTIWSTPAPELPEDAEETNAMTPQPNQPALALVDDYLLLSNRPEHIERAITARSDSTRSLASELDFKLMASKIRRQPRGRTPGMFSFQRPEEGLRTLYELATAESTRAGMANSDNEFLSRLNGQLDEKPLPPFSKLKDYFAPQSSIMTVDDNGFHYTSIGLRRK